MMRRTLGTLFILVVGMLVGSVLAPVTVTAGINAGAMVYDPVEPHCVLFDTRVSEGGSGAIAGGGTRLFDLTGNLTNQGGDPNCEVDPDARGFQINLVAVNPQGPGNLKAWRGNLSEPNGGIVNYQGINPNLNNSNAFIVKAPPANGLKVKANGATVDVRGILYGHLFWADDRYALKADLERVLTGRVDINPHDFVVDNLHQDRYQRDFRRVAAQQDQSLILLYAPVYLPQGATVTRVVMVGTDNGGGTSSRFVFDLLRTEITPTAVGNPSPEWDSMASARSSDSGFDKDAVREIEDTTIACLLSGDPNCAVVDNTQYNYTLELQMSDTSAGFVAVYGAYIEYTLP